MPNYLQSQLRGSMMSNLNFLNHTHTEVKEFKHNLEKILNKITYLKYDKNADASQLDRQTSNAKQLLDDYQKIMIRLRYSPQGLREELEEIASDIELLKAGPAARKLFLNIVHQLNRTKINYKV